MQIIKVTFLILFVYIYENISFQMRSEYFYKHIRLSVISKKNLFVCLLAALN